MDDIELTPLEQKLRRKAQKWRRDHPEEATEMDRFNEESARKWNAEFDAAFSAGGEVWQEFVHRRLPPLPPTTLRELRKRMGLL